MSDAARWVPILSLLLLNACAPIAREDAEPTPEPTAVTAAQPPAQSPAQPPQTPAMTRVRPQPQPAVAAPRFDPANPDWKLRYTQLRDHYTTQFEAPETGQTVEVLLATGRAQQGVLEALTEEELTLNIGTGLITLHVDSLAESSRAEFFRGHYAHLNALARGRVEFACWQEMRDAANRPPAPPPAVTDTRGGDTPVLPPREQRPTRIVGGNDGLNAAHRLDPNAPPPQNEGPKGRVWQVDQYIRKNAAIPHSLRFLEWGRVQKQGENYTVRVRYTLESAEGLGTSTEDMMFFMYADGSVFRKAAANK